MDEIDYKKQYKSSACSRAPWTAVIEPGKRDSVMRQIRIECVQEYGYSLDTCPSRSVCIGKSCLGRELPFKSKTALPYLKKMEALGLIKNQQFYVEDCSSCSIRNDCTSVCPLMNDYLNRHQKQQPDLVYQETLDNYASAGPERPVMPAELKDVKLPWDCLSASRKAVVELRLYERKDFLTIARKCDLFNQSESKYIFYSSLTKLSEYAIVREFLKEKGKFLTLAQNQVLKARYIENKQLSDIAKDRNVDISAISHLISRVFDRYSITWPVYVRKEKGKVIYNVPEVLQ